jgi:hypothetical protein
MAKDKKKYKQGIDFIIVSYGKFEYVPLCVKSIKKYWKGIDHTIYIVVNYMDEERDIAIHNEMFKDYEDIVILKGIDQSNTTQINEYGSITQAVGTNAPGYPIGLGYGKIDNCRIGAGGYYGAWAINIAIKKGTRKYVCVLDQDTIFLSSYATKLLDIDFNKYKIISNRWCPGSVFTNIRSNKIEDGMMRPMLLLCERSLYDEIETENYVDNDVWTSSPWNVDYRDIGGNLTWYLNQKNYSFLVLFNSYRDRFRPDNGAWQHHVLNITEGYAEQAWLDDTPIFFHHGRGGYRRADSMKQWISEVEKYLTNN